VLAGDVLPYGHLAWGAFALTRPLYRQAFFFWHWLQLPQQGARSSALQRGQRTSGPLTALAQRGQVFVAMVVTSGIR